MYGKKNLIEIIKIEHKTKIIFIKQYYNIIDTKKRRKKKY